MPVQILLADDSVTIHKVIAMTFAGEDYDITAVDNGNDALVKAREIMPGIIIADVVMPQKNGYELCEAIKNDPELKNIPVLLMAGTFETFDEGLSSKVRADGCVTKPFESQTLIRKVKELIDARVKADEAAKETEHADPAVARPAVHAQIPVSEEQLRAALSQISREVIEKIVREVVPDMAEMLIKEEIKRLQNKQ